MAGQLKEVRERAASERERTDLQQERTDLQQERIDLAARELSDVSDRLQAAANALRESHACRLLALQPVGVFLDGCVGP